MFRVRRDPRNCSNILDIHVLMEACFVLHWDYCVRTKAELHSSGASSFTQMKTLDDQILYKRSWTLCVFVSPVSWVGAQGGQRSGQHNCPPQHR